MCGIERASPRARVCSVVSAARSANGSFPRALMVGAPAQTFATEINAPWQRTKASLRLKHSSIFMGGCYFITSLLNYNIDHDCFAVPNFRR